MINRSKLSPANLEALRRLEELYGKSLKINSGHRTPDYNASVNGAKNSQHIDGNAIDIDAANMSNEERLRLANAAKQSGFKGFGFYNDSLHFDVGNPRIWGPDYTKNSVPDYANSWYNMNNSGGPKMAFYPQTPQNQREEEPRQTGLRGLLSSFMTPNQTTGLSPMETFGASLDNLKMRQGGDRIRARGPQRLAQQGKNRTIEMLRQKGRDDLADAVESGALGMKEAMAIMFAATKDSRTAQIKNYEYWLSQGKTPAEAQALADSSMKINMPGEISGEEALRKKLLTNKGESFNKMADAGYAAASTLSDLELLRQLAPLNVSGPVVGRLAEAFPDMTEIGSVTRAIITRVAPTLRVEGSGSTSDIEFNAMLKSLGSFANTPEANQAIAEIMIKRVNFMIARKDLVEAYTAGTGPDGKPFNYTDLSSGLKQLEISQGIVDGTAKALIKKYSPQESTIPDKPEGINQDTWDNMTDEQKRLF